MGKRELLLIVGFIVAGIMVYHATAPEPAPGHRGFSFKSFVDHVRREVGGNRASTEVTTAGVHPIPGTVRELRLNIRSAQITITGEDRVDVSSELFVLSKAYDEAEAQSLAKQTKLQIEPAGPTLMVSISAPKTGSQRQRLHLKIPARLLVQMEPSLGKLDLSGVAGVELETARGEATIKHVTGRVAVTHRGGVLTIEDVGTVKLDARGSDVRLKRVEGESTLQVQGGDLKAEDMAGPLELNSNGGDVSFVNLSHTRGPIKINAADGTVRLNGLAVEARIDGRNTEIEVALDKAAPLTIYSEGDEGIEVTLPPGGLELDARANDGRITLPEGLLEVRSTETEQRAAGPIRGGGPTVTLRASRGDIIVRSRGNSER
jgi:hypothetical protein